MIFENIQISGGITFIPEILTPSGDPYWANVSLLMNTTTTNDQTNNVFLDSSSNNFTVTRAGTTTQGSFTPFAVAPNTSYSTSVNGGSGYFTTGNYLSVPDNAVLQLGSSNFTIEFWMKTASNNAVIISKDSDTNVNYGSLAIETTVAGKLEFYCNPQSGSLANRVTLTSTTTVSNDQWHHIAIVRNGNNWNLYVNGVSEASATSAVGFWSAANPLYISATLVSSSPSATYIGSLSSLRIVKGTAVYTSAFTPSTIPLTAIANTSLLLNFTNGGVFDGTTNNNLTTIGDAKVSTTESKFAPTSVFFDGTGDHLSMPDSNELEFGSGDFTIEGWIYISSYVNSSAILAKGADISAPYLIFIGASNEIAFYSSSNGSAWNVADLRFATNPATNTWHYIAVTRSGNTYRTFFNGVQANSVTVSGALFNNTSNLFVGKYASTSFNGYMQDIRITKGVARYTAGFTPPTEPFPTN